MQLGGRHCDAVAQIILTPPAAPRLDNTKLRVIDLIIRKVTHGGGQDSLPLGFRLKPVLVFRHAGAQVIEGISLSGSLTVRCHLVGLQLRDRRCGGFGLRCAGFERLLDLCHAAADLASQLGDVHDYRRIALVDIGPHFRPALRHRHADRIIAAEPFPRLDDRQLCHIIKIPRQNPSRFDCAGGLGIVGKGRDRLFSRREPRLGGIEGSGLDAIIDLPLQAVQRLCDRGHGHQPALDGEGVSQSRNGALHSIEVHLDRGDPRVQAVDDRDLRRV